MKRLFNRITAISLYFFFISTFLQAQTDLKKLKKSIPAKGIKSLEQSTFSDRLFIYRTKQDTGLWDVNSKKILLKGLKKVSPTPFNQNWITYETSSGYGVYDLSETKPLVSSRSQISLHNSEDSTLIDLISTGVIGFLDVSRNRGFWVSSSLKEDSVLFDDGEFSFRYEAATSELSYGHYEEGLESNFGEDDEGEGEMVTYFEPQVSLYHKAGYAWESGKAFSLASGDLKQENIWSAEPWKEYFISSRYGAKSYYDKDLNLIFENLKEDGYEVSHFQRFVDPGITKVEHITRSVYLCMWDSKRRFFSSRDMEPISPFYDFTFAVGKDFLHYGYSFFTVREGSGYGLFNTRRLELFEPTYNLIEKRAFPDGSHWYRVDNQLHRIKSSYNDSTMVKTWDPETDNSTVLYHLSVEGGNLILSLRRTTADTHDSAHYTATDFRDGSGVINLADTTWRIEPEYHTITPYKEHYVVMEPGSFYHNASHLKTTILDKEFKQVSKEEFRASFIYNNMLIVQTGMGLATYDIEKRAVVRELGLVNEQDADFQLIDGYLVIGDNNYERRGNKLTDMDISDIISPDGEKIEVPGFHGRYQKGDRSRRFRFIKMIGEGLVIIGRVKKDEPTDEELHRLKTDASAIFDLRSRKVITSWSDRIFLNYGGKSVYYKKVLGEEGIDIPVKKIRETFKP